MRSGPRVQKTTSSSNIDMKMWMQWREIFEELIILQVLHQFASAEASLWHELTGPSAGKERVNRIPSLSWWWFRSDKRRVFPLCSWLLKIGNTWNMCHWDRRLRYGGWTVLHDATCGRCTSIYLLEEASKHSHELADTSTSKKNGV